MAFAFDEFQQIQNYPEKNVEALLRSEIQKDTGTCYIFSGSQTHLILSMFNEYSRPFYQSSEIMQLGKINMTEYTGFITHHFGTNKKTVSGSTAEYIYKISNGITYNVQYLCNKLFSLGENEITGSLADEMIQRILKENEVVYYNYRELLTGLQFKNTQGSGQRRNSRKTILRCIYT